MPTNRSEWKATSSAETLRIVERLKQMHAEGDRARTAGADPLSKMLSPTDASFGKYADLQSRIAGLETQMRAHSDTVDRVVETTAPPSIAPTMTQATLFLQGAPDGQTGGKFVCRNRLDRTAEIELVIGDFKDSKDRPIESVNVTVEGLSPALAPSEARQLKCRIGLAACSPSPHGVLEGWVDFRMAGASALRLWIEVDLHE